jgi:hypothetical protein
VQLAAHGGRAEEALVLRTAAHLQHLATLGNRSRNYTTTSLATAAPIEAPRTLQMPNEDQQSVGEQRKRDKLQRAVKKQLTYLEDPWKIAQHVDLALAKDRYDEALLLTQRASKEHQVVVAWNHLISYQLEKQQLKKAIKLYNEVSCIRLREHCPLLDHTT